MSALSKRAAEVEHELGAAWIRYHVGAQAARFVTGVVVALLLSLHNGFTDWTDVLPLLAGAMWTTAAQMWPQVPWSLIRDRIDPPKRTVYATGGYIPGPGPSAMPAVGLAQAARIAAAAPAPKTVAEALGTPPPADPAPPTSASGGVGG